VLAVGDSLEHDVAGAVGSGLDAAFVVGGIHRHDVAWPTPGAFDEAGCARLIAKSGWRARYAIASFAL
jgi:ribonucleotide monophosphatase NagD (HAD superfamily)